MREVNILVESMTKLTMGAMTIRCWRHEPGEVIDYTVTRELILAAAKNFDRTGKNIRDMAIHIVKEVSEINAVEILDENGNGVVVYADWP